MSIAAPLKTKIWDIYIGREVAEVECPLCENENIRIIKFHGGHVLATSRGGDYSLENLRPICCTCNTSMGNRHMKDFALKFFPNSPLIDGLPDNPHSKVKSIPNRQITQKISVPIMTKHKSFMVIMEQFMKETQASMKEIKETLEKKIDANCPHVSNTSPHVSNTSPNSANILSENSNDVFFNKLKPFEELPKGLVYMKNCIFEYSIENHSIIAKNYILKYHGHQTIKETTHVLTRSYLKVIDNLQMFISTSEKYTQKSVSKLNPIIHHVTFDEIGAKVMCSHCHKYFATKGSYYNHISKHCAVLKEQRLFEKFSKAIDQKYAMQKDAKKIAMIHNNIDLNQ